MNNVPFIVNRILENGDCYLERKSDLAVIKRTKHELRDALSDGDLIIHGNEAVRKSNDRSDVDIKGLPQVDQRLVMRKYHYVKAARSMLGEKVSKIELETVITMVAEQLSDDNPPSVSSVYRWWRSWKQCNYDPRVLASKQRGAKGTRKFKGTVTKELNRIVDEVYLTRQRVSKQATYDAFLAQLASLNAARISPLRIPSRSTFYRMLEDLDRHDEIAAREGKRVADKVFRSTGLGAQPNNILERIEVDHTPLDVHVLNPDTALADGRPYLTLLLDRYSRMPLGLEIGFEPPSELSVMRALRNSILSKKHIKEEYSDIKNDWPAYGIPAMLVCDNGMEFHSHQLRRMCGELDIDLQFCPKAQPEYKGAVERFLGTLNRDVCHKLPGTTFSNIRHRGDYNSVAETAITIDDLKELVYEWIADIYCQKTHKVTQRTPFALWNEGLKIIEPRLPESKDQLDLILTTEEERTLSHRGVEINGLFYNSADLGFLRRRSMESIRVKVRYDKEDIGFIWVYDDYEGNYLKAPCIDMRYAEGLTYRQHKQIKEEARAQGVSDQDTDALIQNKERLRKKMKAMSSHKLLRTRRKAARDNTGVIKEPLGPEVWSAKEAEVGNEKYIMDEWDIDEIPQLSVTEVGV